jgi:hypothetical protein
VFAGLAFVALYLTSLSIFIARSPELFGSVAVFLAAFSSASMLAVERGNNDLLTFALVFFGVQSPTLALFLFFL